MEENNNMDTPQPQTANTTGMDPFGAPVEANEGSNNDNLSVEDAFFAPSESNNQAAPEEGQPAESQENVTTEQPYEAKNDEKRFEYWQSQAAKKENELNAYKSQVENAIRQQQLQQQAPSQTAENVESFPPPPVKPEKPQGFNRQEAWDDPQSPSAQYLDGVEQWRDNMVEYGELKSQYESALVREQMQRRDEAAQQQAQRQRAIETQKKQVRDIYENVTGHYGLSDEQAKDFIMTMSDPNSLTMDNLVQLYRMQNGAPPVNTQGTEPSAAFQQSRNAQQVPSPMGVMPGQATQSQRSDADTIMDDLINTHKSKNPWS